MKLTKEVLRGMINEVLTENREPSMLLTEREKKSKYDRIIDALKGKTEGIDSVGLMSGQNPMAKAVSQKRNTYLKGRLEAKIKDMGLEMIRIGGEFSNNPEQSVMILNPTEDQMEVLITAPNQPIKAVVHYLNFLADLQLDAPDGATLARETLQRIVTLYPNTPWAELAHSRASRLNLENKSKEPVKTLKLGVYEQNIGLKPTVETPEPPK